MSDPLAGVRAARRTDLLYHHRYPVALGETIPLNEHAAYYAVLPRVLRRDQHDYPKIVRWAAAAVTLERIWALADRPCAGCGVVIAQHSFYVRVTDHHDTSGPFIAGRRLPVPTDHHPACVPPRYAPALLRLEVPE